MDIFSKLVFLVLLKVLLIAVYIYQGSLGLGPDEAQYWTWSQELDWGYYSKPPGIAWQIRLGTLVFGQTELGVRAFSLIFSAIQTLLIYGLARRSGLSQSAAFWSAVMMMLSPIGVFGSIFAITDGGFLLFWTLGCLWIVDSLESHRRGNPWVFALIITLGALFKWPIYGLWLFYLLVWVKHFSGENPLRVLGSFIFSLIGLLPSLWWNWHHDWATFRHVGSTIGGGHGPSRPNFFEFFGSQALLVSPLLFVLLLLALYYVVKNRKKVRDSVVFCGIVTGICLTIGLGFSLVQKMQGNWILFAYPTAFVLIAWLTCEYQEWRKNWMKGGVVFSLFVVGFSLTLPFLGLYFPWIAKMSPFKHQLGWETLQSQLKAAGYNPADAFLVSDKYQTTSELSFYSEGQKRAYFLNLEGARRNQFSYWPDISVQEQGKTGYFVWVENEPYLSRQIQSKREFYLAELPHYFEEVEEPRFLPLVTVEGQVMKGALIFRCSYPKERRPESSVKF